MRSVLQLLALPLLLVSLSAEYSDALAPEFQARAQRKAVEMYIRRPAYIYQLGGDPEKGFIDCSKFVQKVFEDENIIAGHPRTQAWRIFKGHDGFLNRSVDADEPTETADILCLAVPGSLQRPHGINHVGLVIRWKGDWAVVDANASTKGIRIMPIEGIWTKWLHEEGWRRLTIGD